MKSTYHYLVKNGKLIPLQQPTPTNTQKTTISYQQLVNQYETKIKQLQLELAAKNQQLKEKQNIISQLTETSILPLSFSYSPPQKQPLTQIPISMLTQRENRNSFSSQQSTADMSLSRLQKRLENSQRIISNMKAKPTSYIPYGIEKWAEEILHKHQHVCELLERLVVEHNEEIAQIREYYEGLLGRPEIKGRWSMEESLWEKEDDSTNLY